MGTTYHVVCPGCSTQEKLDSLYYEPFQNQYDDGDLLRESAQWQRCAVGHRFLVRIDSVPYARAQLTGLPSP